MKKMSDIYIYIYIQNQRINKEGGSHLILSPDWRFNVRLGGLYG